MVEDQLVSILKEVAREVVREEMPIGLLDRKEAAKFLSFSPSGFDKWIAYHEHLKKRSKGSRPKYCPKELLKAFNNG